MINSLMYSQIPSDELLTFGTRVIALFDGKVTEGTPIDVFLKVFKLKYKDFAGSFMHKDRNPYTEIIAMADAFRDDEYFAFRYHIQACSHTSLEGWSEAANKIIVVLRKHGWRVTSLGYKAESAALINISAELHEKFQPELTLTASTDWLNRLDIGQKKFEAVMLMNVAEISNDTATVTITRPPFTSALRNLFGYISLQNEVASTPELADYVTKINDLIVLTTTTVKANETRKANQKKTGNTGTSKV